MISAYPSTATRFASILKPAIRPLSETHAWNRLLQRVNATWATNRILARVTRRVEESADTVSLWLQPNRRWRGHRAGQHVCLGVEIDGVMRQRVFTISNAGARHAPLRISFRRQPGTGVTAWLHQHARPGQIVELSAAQGQFTLPEPLPGQILLLAGGSGITPMMAMLHELATRRYDGSIVLLQLCRSTAEQLFVDELAHLQSRLPGLQSICHFSALHGRLEAKRIEALVPDLGVRHTMLCGPATWMSDVTSLYADRGWAARLQQEHFAAPRPVPASGEANEFSVQASQSEQMFTQAPGLSLLQSAEAAGLTPRYGCRAGLCRTCLCRKQSGSVRNLLTGLRSSEPDEWIQLCVSVAESELDLAI